MGNLVNFSQIPIVRIAPMQSILVYYYILTLKNFFNPIQSPEIVADTITEITQKMTYPIKGDWMVQPPIRSDSENGLVHFGGVLGGEVSRLIPQ